MGSKAQGVAEAVVGVTYVCLYFGRSDECQECGGFSQTGTQFCSHDCAASQAARVASQDAEVSARRAREDAFADAAAALRAQGHTDEEIDLLLIGMPS